MEEKAYIDIVANGLEKRIVEMKEEFNKKIDNIEKDNKERDKSINNMTKEIVLLSENMKINTESNKALTETINRLEKRLEDNKNALGNFLTSSLKSLVSIILAGTIGSGIVWGITKLFKFVIGG